MDELRRIGARSVPVVSKGDDFVFAQVIKDVVDFLELEDDTAPDLSPAELAGRWPNGCPDFRCGRSLMNRFLTHSSWKSWGSN